jgi:alpha-L-fucosidase
LYGEGPTKVEAGSFHDADTKPYTAEDFRFTTKGNSLYAIELGWPGSNGVVIHALGTSGLGSQHIQSVEMLGSAGELKYERQADGLHITAPTKPAGESAYVYRITLDGPVQTDPKYK